MAKLIALFATFAILKLASANPTVALRPSKASSIQAYLKFAEDVLRNRDSEERVRPVTLDNLDCVYSKLKLSKHSSVRPRKLQYDDEKVIAVDLAAKICDTEVEEEEIIEDYAEEFRYARNRGHNDDEIECGKQIFMKIAPNANIFHGFSEEKLQKCYETDEGAEEMANLLSRGHTCGGFFILTPAKDILKGIIGNEEPKNEELVRKASKYLYEAKVKLLESKFACQLKTVNDEDH